MKILQPFFKLIYFVLHTNVIASWNKETYATLVQRGVLVQYCSNAVQY
jgi:hypothetical protein